MSLLTRARRLFVAHASREARSYRRAARRLNPSMPLGESLEDRVLLSHFRYGNVSWQPVSGTPNAAIFHFTYAARIDSSSDTAAEKVGDIVTDETGGNASFAYGDGANSGGVLFQVTSVTSTYYTAQAVRGNATTGYTEGLVHTYAAAGNYTASYSSSARISTLRNNADGSYQLSTIVNIGTGNSSPVSSIPAIVQVPDNQIFTFQVPAIDPNGDPLAYRFATSLEASGFATGYTLPPNMTISPTGLITWDVRNSVTTTAPDDLWTAQVVVEDHNAATGALKSKIPLDFILQIVGATSQPPVFDSAPSGVLTPVAGQTLTFVVQASDPVLTNSVTLQALNPPLGATFTNVAPAAGSRANAVALQGTFTPTATQAGQTFVITFLATNSAGLTAQTQVTISPQASPAPTVISAQVNDGGIQRSLVQSVQFTFNKLVNIAAGAFVLTTPGGVQPVTVNSTTSTVSNQTVALLTFAGAGITNSSLEDGRYVLTILANRVTDSLSQTLASNYTFNFFRLFGDSNGNAVIDNTDAYLFKTTYNLSSGQAGYLSAFDYNGDGKVDAADMLQFRLRYTVTI